MKRENKINLIIVIIVIVIVACVAFVLLSGSTTTSNVEKIDINQLKEKIDNKDSFILVITQDSCSHCKAFLPVINKIGRDYNITFYDISRTGLSEEDSTYLKNLANTSGTPTTVFIVDGEEKATTNRLVGNVAENRVIEKLKVMGYINE